MKNKSLKKILIIYSMISLFCILTALLLYDKVNTNLVNKYDMSMQKYEYLNEFYKKQSNANDNFKSYLYTKSEKEYIKYEEDMESAGRTIRKLESLEYESDIVWRFTLLANMLEDYNSQAKITKKAMEQYVSTYDEEYSLLIEKDALLNDTSDTYYEFITKEMVILRENLKVNKKDAKYASYTTIAISVGFIFGYVFLLLKGITKPIDKIIENIQKIKEGKYDLREISSSNKEMEVLCLALKNLAENIENNLVKEKEIAILEKKLLLTENEILKKDEVVTSTKLRLLQTQMNPHFLFNSMNMIYQKAMQENSPLTKEMIEKMIECLRYTMNQGERTATLEMEIAFVRNYLFIQSARFEDRIQFILKVDENLPNIKIPAMIIEPIIENSIKHGLFNMSNGGVISIDIEKYDDKICIHVSDNGKGMDTDKLELLIMNNYKVDGRDKINLGLYNLQQRLYMYYGNMASISLTSCEGCGFETTINIKMK